MDVLVAGAGVAGLSTAIALTEAGHRVTISERAGELREVGAALSLWPNALAALDTLGVGDAVRAIGVAAPTDAIRSTSGQVLVELDHAAVTRAMGGEESIVLRSGLQEVLLMRARQMGVEIRLGQRVDKVHALPSRVIVGEGDDASSYDAVVGADGINSEVRRAVVTRGALRDCHRLARRALITDTGLVKEAWLTVGVGLQVIASPAPEGMIYWAADAPEGGGSPTDLLRRHFGDWHDPIPQLIEVTPADAWLVDRIYDWPKPDTYCRGRLLLVGDAAHPMTPDLGQGACQAIEDAAVLSAIARARPTLGPVELFQRLERIRLPRVRRIVRDSYWIGRLALLDSPLAARARDLVTRITPDAVSNAQLKSSASVGSFQRQLALV